MEDLIALFPTKDQQQLLQYRSFLFQPEKISINSEQDEDVLTSTTQQSAYESETYSSFTNKLVKPALHVKSLQLHHATIPNAVCSIPNNETLFIYRRITNDGAANFAPNTNQASFSSSFRFVRLLRTDDWSPNDPVFYDNNKTPSNYGFNRIFNDYEELTIALNKAAENDPLQSLVPPLILEKYFVPNDIQFSYDSTTNKVFWTPKNAINLDICGNAYPNIYYTEVGYNDPLLPQFLQEAEAELSQYMNPGTFRDLYRPLNVRLGYPWNGLLPNPSSEIYPTLLSTRMRPVPDFSQFSPWKPILNYYAQTFANLVHTHNVFLYCDIVGGSSQNTGTDLPLLAVVPMATGQLGVNCFENKTQNPLTKITNNINEITITMRTDTGAPFTLPNSAPVNIELSLSY